MSEPKRYNEWYGLLFNLDAKERQKWVKQVIEDIREESKRTKNKDMAKLADFLENPSECQIIGFAPGYEYLLAKNDGRSEWEKSYIHPTSQVCLFVRSKKVPMFMIVGATLKWNKSDLPIGDVIGGTG